MAGLPVAIIADDLTGAADTAATFARPGRAVPVSLGPEPRLAQGRQAFAVTTESRMPLLDWARDRVSAAARYARANGAGLIYKKVDSNLRGNIGAELAALRDARLGPILLAPAFPARGRTTIRGIALIDGVPVAETEMARDAEAPVTHSRIAALLSAQQDDLRIEHCNLGALREAASTLARLLAGCDVLVVDAETDADLDLIAQTALALQPAPVLAGSAGLAGAVARHLLGPPARPTWPEGQAGPILAVLASSSERLIGQVAAAGGSAAVIRLSCAALSCEDGLVPELNEAIADAVGVLREGQNVLVHATGPLLKGPNPVGLIVEHLAHLAFVVVRQAALKGLLVGGGSTAQAVLWTLGTAAVEVDDEPLPGIAAGLAVGGELDGRPVVLKAGAAGEKSAVAELIHYLGRRAAAAESEV